MPSPSERGRVRPLYSWRPPVRKQTSGECRAAFYTAKSVGNRFKWKVEPEAEFLWRDKVVEMKITDRAVVILVVMTGRTKVLALLLKTVLMVAFGKMLVAESVKRLVDRCK